MKKLNIDAFVFLAVMLLTALLGLGMVRINARSPRMDTAELSARSEFPENGPVMLTGGAYLPDEEGNKRYAYSLHWDSVAYLYFPRAQSIEVEGSNQPIQEAYRGTVLQLERTETNQGDYRIILTIPGNSRSEADRCVYFGNYEQISGFLNFSVLTNYYVQGMCFAVMLLSAVLFLFKRSERYLIWLVLLCFLRGSYYRLSSVIDLLRWIPGVSVLTVSEVYLVATEMLAAFLQYKIMENFMPVKLGKLAFPWYALMAAFPILLVWGRPFPSALVTMLFYLVLYTCYLLCFLRMREEAEVERGILLLGWALTVLLRFFDELCELGLIPSGDMNLKLRLRGLGSVVFVVAFFLVVGKRFAQKFQEADDLNEELEAQIRQKTRQQTVFVRSMLHNLKTPLFSLSGYSDMALRSVEKRPEQARQYMEKAREKAIFAGELIDHLFLVTQMDADMVQMRFAPVDLRHLLEAVLDTPTAGQENKTIRTRLEVPENVYLQADQLYLRQAIQNIVDNARIHTPDGGSILLSVQTDAQGAEIHIRDTGPGIAPEEIDKIFDAYYSNRHGKQQSSGLGLYIASEIVKRHRGRLRVESSLGEGSDFILWLPYSNGAEPSENI